MKTVTIAAVVSLFLVSCNAPQERRGVSIVGDNRAPLPCDCYAECESLGFYCADQDACECGDVIDTTCSDGAHKVCECADYQCSFEEWLFNYVTCFQWEEQPDAEMILCFGVYYSHACDVAIPACTQ